MKTSITFLALLIFYFTLTSFNSKNDEVIFNEMNIDGATLFNKKACNLCHHPTRVIVGPSIRDISTAYKGDEKAILNFLNGKGVPIVQPEEFNYMKPVLNQLKNMKPEERQALADYIAGQK